jgi:hypothetical protein
MQRKTFDVLTSVVGLIVMIVLLAAGALLFWGHDYVNSNVRTQLAEQHIYFPPKAAFAHAKPGTEITPSMIPSVSQYAGEQLLTGPQAKAYADDFIAVHLSEMPYGGVYASISAAARANPGNARLGEVEQASFQGTTLRGLLLEAYAFSTVGTVLLWASIGAFSLSLLMWVLICLGFWHSRHTSPGQELRVGGSGEADHRDTASS